MFFTSNKFDNLKEFITALYIVHYSYHIKNKKQYFEKIFNDYRTFGIHCLEFENFYNELLHNTPMKLTDSNLNELNHLNGRLLSLFDLVNLKIKIHRLPSSFVSKIKTIEKINGNFLCLSCGNNDNKNFFHYDNLSYCTQCLDFSLSDNRLPKFHIHCKTTNIKDTITLPKTKLSEAQKIVSNNLITNTNKGLNTLIWAVCGAGKTEIVYKQIFNYLKNNKTVCLCVPRKDVVKELAVRFLRDFPNIDINILYADNKTLTNSPFYIMTTHQLIKYYHFFDLIIVDEVDAFPYNGDVVLEKHPQIALKENSNIIFLSATPSKKIKNYVDDIIKLPIRYHKKLLPIPRIKIEKKLNLTTLSKHLKTFIINCLNNNRRCLIFAPTIEISEKLANLLNNNGFNCNYVHSKDIERDIKIDNFRSKKINILVTTTILERGVTFDYLDVLIFNADHNHFSKEALIQIAGRVGRKIYDSSGDIIFLTTSITTTINLAIKEIKYMNNLATYRKLERS